MGDERNEYENDNENENENENDNDNENDNEKSVKSVTSDVYILTTEIRRTRRKK